MQSWSGLGRRDRFDMRRKLSEYSAKRSFKATPEPAAGRCRRRAAGRCCSSSSSIRRRRLHYDFRLECDGVLKSWAVPKGPSLDPADKRLAVHTEDHPVRLRLLRGRHPARAVRRRRGDRLGLRRLLAGRGRGHLVPRPRRGRAAGARGARRRASSASSCAARSSRARSRWCAPRTARTGC